MSDQEYRSLLARGVRAATAGDSAGARVLLRQATESDPGGVEAWLWLARTAVTGDESLEALRRARATAPDDRRVGSAYEQLLLREGIAAAKGQAKPRAWELLRELSELTPRDERVWLWRASVARGYAEAMECLTRVLEITPGQPQAEAALARLRDRLAARDSRPSPDPSRTATGSAGPDGNTPGPLPTTSSVQPQVVAVTERTSSASMPDAELRPATAPRHDAVIHRGPADPPASVETTPASSATGTHGSAGITTPADRPSATPAVTPSAPASPHLRIVAAEAAAVDPAVKPAVSSPPSAGPTTDPPSSVPDVPRVSAHAAPPPNAPSRPGSILHLFDTSRPESRPATPEPGAHDAVRTPVAAHGAAPPPARLTTTTPPPVSTPAAPARDDRPAAPQEQAEPPRGLVLVVDDSPTVLKVVSYELKKHKLEVLTAPGGTEALDTLQRVTPDLVLLDINMADMDGYQVCRAIRSGARTSRIPVVMLSGKDGFFDKIRGRMAGAVDYITKPFEPHVLVSMIEKYFPVRL